MALETLSQLFEHITTTFNKPDHLIYRGSDGKFYNISTNEFRDRVVDFALGLKQLGVKSDTKIVLLSENRPEWHITDFACHLLSAVLVPVFPTLVPEQIEYIANNSESEFIVVSNQEQANKVFQIRDKVKKLKQIVSFNGLDAADGLVSFEEILAKGREKNDKNFLSTAVKNAKPDMLATLIYTSGTTGVPKGVMLSHSNFISNVLGCSEILKMSETDKGLSFLPLSHAFERTVDYTYLYQGASIVYSSSIENVARDMEESGPTVMAAVPRFYEKVKAKIETKSTEAGGLKKQIFDWAVGVGTERVEKEQNRKPVEFWLNLKNKIADVLVFSKIRERTGGNIRYFISGGAPLSAEVAKFFQAAGLTILEGYGLTETSPVITVNPIDRPRFGTVGRLLSGVEVKIAEDGEVLAKGPNVMMGYYKMPEATKEVMEGEWFHTGDIGKLDDEGYLSITDRKKQLIVTSVGKKIAPQVVEKQVESSRYIEQVVLIGEQRKFISALIVPDFEALKIYAADNGISADGPDDLVGKDVIKDLIRNEVEEGQKNLSHYEKIHKFRLLPETFSIESGELTPTMKIRRKVVLDKYADLIEEMYSESED